MILNPNLDLGVPQFWKEIKNQYKNQYKFKEIFYSGHLMECGIGLIAKKINVLKY